MLKVHSIHSPDLEPPNLPHEPDDCCIAIQLDVGFAGGSGADTFQFEVVTPKWLLRNQEATWGKGLLIVPSFSWEVVQHSVAKLLASSSSQTWEEAAIALSRQLDWEFENYRPSREDET